MPSRLALRAQELTTALEQSIQDNTDMAENRKNDRSTIMSLVMQFSRRAEALNASLNEDVEDRIETRNTMSLPNMSIADAADYVSKCLEQLNENVMNMREEIDGNEMAVDAADQALNRMRAFQDSQRNQKKTRSEQSPYIPHTNRVPTPNGRPASPVGKGMPLNPKPPALETKDNGKQPTEKTVQAKAPSPSGANRTTSNSGNKSPTSTKK